MGKVHPYRASFSLYLRYKPKKIPRGLWRPQPKEPSEDLNICHQSQGQGSQAPNLPIWQHSLAVTKWQVYPTGVSQPRPRSALTGERVQRQASPPLWQPPRATHRRILSPWEKVIWDLFLTLGSGTSSAWNENLRPPLNTNIPLSTTKLVVGNMALLLTTGKSFPREEKWENRDFLKNPLNYRFWSPEFWLFIRYCARTSKKLP